MRTRFYTIIFGLLLTTFFAFAPAGDNTFAALIGKEAGSAELKDFVSAHSLEMVNSARYFSKDGIELKLKGGVVNEIHLYNNSTVYGSYKGELPSGLKFGMASGTVKGMLGKPTVSYNSGYCEYEYDTYILSCWFEGGALNQVVVSAKAA